MQKNPVEKTSQPPAKKKPRSPRKYTDGFRAGAVRLVTGEGRTFVQVAADLDLSVSVLTNWVRLSKADAGQDVRGTITASDREELSRLRKANKVVKHAREILKKPAFFAKENG